MTWTAVALTIPLRLEEELVAAADDESIGCELLDVQGERGRLRIYADSATSANRVVERLESALARHGLDGVACDLLTESVADGKWVERYQAKLRPMPVGRGFLVDPTGRCVAPVGRTRLAVVPGRAFGTGEHPTTRLAVEALERHVAKGSHWVDLGCGSGILAMVAHHRGAGRVAAVDDDPEAIRVARRTLAGNGLERTIDLRQGSIDEARGSWNGVVANIASAFFVESGAGIAGLLGPGGLLIATGFYDTDVEEVDLALGFVGLRHVDRRVRDGWALVRYRLTEVA